jgi:hypothetical protein
MVRNTDATEYLNDHPELQKWIHACRLCHRVGHRVDLPQKLGMGVAAQNLRRYFPQLILDGHGRCEQCAAEATETPGSRQMP